MLAVVGLAWIFHVEFRFQGGAVFFHRQPFRLTADGVYVRPFVVNDLDILKICFSHEP